VRHGDAHDLDIGLLDDGAAVLAAVLVAGDELTPAPVRPVEGVLEDGQAEGVFVDILEDDATIRTIDLDATCNRKIRNIIT
jgi:hypothetical protein